MLQRRVSPYRLRRLTWTAVAAVLIVLSIGVLAQERTLPTPNYELASRWMSAKVAKLVFDTRVAPHWAEQTDRFWYAYETAQGRKFYLVDPLKKGKTPLWDNAKMAAMLTGTTRIPYDSQHLPITAATMKWAKQDAVIRFEVEVPKDADVVGEKKKQEVEKQEVKGIIEERLNTYVDTQPLWTLGNGQEFIHWSERDGWGHYYLFDAAGKWWTRSSRRTSGSTSSCCRASATRTAT